MFRLLFFILAATAGAVSCCHAGGKISVVATIFPVFDFARQIGGDGAEVHLLLPPGVEAHSYAPTPGDMARIRKADIFIYTSETMEPWVKELAAAVSSEHLLVLEAAHGLTAQKKAEEAGHGENADLPEEHGHGGHDSCDHGKDPHVWLDPLLAMQMATKIGDALSSRNPAGESLYKRNTADYLASILALHKETEEVLSRCKKRTLVYGGHSVFGRFASRYGLEFVSPYRGFSPDAAPGPKALAELIRKMKKEGLSVVFHEELLDPKVARIIAGETGARLMLLHGCHNLSRDEIKGGATYISIMRANLENLKAGLGYE